MQWSQVRTAYPDQWLVVEALEAHTQERQRILDRIAVIETCSDGKAAMTCYRQLHRAHRCGSFTSSTPAARNWTSWKAHLSACGGKMQLLLEHDLALLTIEIVYQGVALQAMSLEFAT